MSGRHGHPAADRLPPRQGERQSAAAVRDARGAVEDVDLPARGIAGNSHMLMMGHNSDAVAAVVQDWLVARGLWR